MPQGIIIGSDVLTGLNGQTSWVTVSLIVTELQPGIYTADASGSGPGIIANAVTGVLINASNPAHASDFLVIYCTGLGDVRDPYGQFGPSTGSTTPSDRLFRTTAVVQATIGGMSAPVSFAGLTPTFAGLYQVNVQVPAGVGPGEAVSVVITTIDPRPGATAISNSVTIVVQ